MASKPNATMCGAACGTAVNMFVLTSMYFFKPATAASVTDAVQSNVSFGQKTRRMWIAHKKKVGSQHNTPDHQPNLLPNCLMMEACKRSALYHDKRTQGYATPKAHAVKLLPLYTLGYVRNCFITKKEENWVSHIVQPPTVSSQ